MQNPECFDYKMTSPHTPAATASSSAPGWRVGTLVYTTAGLVALFCWLLWGDFAWNMKERAVNPVAQLMLRQFEASDFLVGLLVGSLPSALGLLLGPIISVKSDRHRGRWGRRIPYLLIPTPIAALAMAGLAYTPEFAAVLHESLAASSPGLVACRLLVFAFFWSIFEVFTIIANAVFGGLINDVVPQAVIGRFFGLFRAVSLLAGMIFNFWLIGHAEEHYRLIFLGLAALYGVGFSLMCFFVKEGDYPPPPPLETATSFRSRFAPLLVYLRECFANPYYLWVFLALMLGMLSAGPVNTFSVFYAKSLGMSMDYYGKLLVITFAVSFALSFGLGWLADKFHPLRIGLVALSLYAALTLWAGFFADTPARFSVAFVGHGILAGTFLTAIASLGQRLFPRAKFAQFASASGIVIAFGYMVLPPALGALLDATGHVYRYTFLLSGVISLLGVAAFIVVYRRFIRLGGPSAYVAPGDIQP
jgi:MFS family permease